MKRTAVTASTDTITTRDDRRPGVASRRAAEHDPAGARQAAPARWLWEPHPGPVRGQRQAALTARVTAAWMDLVDTGHGTADLVVLETDLSPATLTAWAAKTPVGAACGHRFDLEGGKAYGRLMVAYADGDELLVEYVQPAEDAWGPRLLLAALAGGGYGALAAAGVRPDLYQEPADGNWLLAPIHPDLAPGIADCDRMRELLWPDRR